MDSTVVAVNAQGATAMFVRSWTELSPVFFPSDRGRAPVLRHLYNASLLG